MVILSKLRVNFELYCPHDKIKTTETKISKLGTEIAHQLILGQKIKLKLTGSKSAKSRDETAVRRRVAAMWRRSTRRRRTAGVSYALYRLPCYWLFMQLPLMNRQFGVTKTFGGGPCCRTTTPSYDFIWLGVRAGMLFRRGTTLTLPFVVSGDCLPPPPAAAYLIVRL